jgi:tetratricopeptide (TPR) repeat protein
VRPHANYLFKHALVQDAAYGTLLREPRRALHALIAETLESQFAEIAETRPELLARHCTEAGLIEKAAELWGKAGQRSLEQSALVEAAEQLTRALGQIDTLRATPALRGEQIKHQVALANAVMHVRGYAAPETKAAVEQARIFIQRAEELAEHPNDPLLLFSVLYSIWAVNGLAFNGDALRELAAEFLSLAEKQGTTAPLLMAHRAMGISLLYAGDFAKARAHLEKAIALYNPTEHRPLATRFVQDAGVHALSYRSWTLWLLGYPNAALADADGAVRDGGAISQAATLMNTLTLANATTSTRSFSTASAPTPLSRTCCCTRGRVQGSTGLSISMPSSRKRSILPITVRGRRSRVSISPWNGPLTRLPVK